MLEIIPTTLNENGVKIMKTEMKKKDKITEIYFNESDSVVYSKTMNRFS